ncbi:MAG: hypothetical protein Ct9H300mP6_04010 [Gammaproteobacteria bacterium]|nr:MAG: hypothetical protein Ct9H300mP6_04010 [Gammaproteobacteria bacterium]
MALMSTKVEICRLSRSSPLNTVTACDISWRLSLRFSAVTIISSNIELLLCETDEYDAVSAIEVKSSEVSSTWAPGSSKAAAPSSPSDALVLKLAVAAKISAVKIKKTYYLLSGSYLSFQFLFFHPFEKSG